MKKLSVLLLSLLFMGIAQAANIGSISTTPNASQVFLPLGENVQVSLQEFSKMSVKEYEQITGTHMNFFKKMSFKITQKKLRRSIDNDGTITNKKLAKAMSVDNPSQGFHIGGFALGFLIGLIGVLIAYLIKGDPDVDRNRRKWAWIGFGAFVVVYAVLLAAAL